MLEHGAQSRFIDEVSHTQSSTCDFVFVGRSDPTPCGTDLCIASSFFTREVEGSVVGHDHVCIGADLQAIGAMGTLRSSSALSSLNSTCGSTTTPEAIRQSRSGCKIPEGIRCKTVFSGPFSPLTTRV